MCMKNADEFTLHNLRFSQPCAWRMQMTLPDWMVLQPEGNVLIMDELNRWQYSFFVYYVLGFLLVHNSKRKFLTLVWIMSNIVFYMFFGKWKIEYHYVGTMHFSPSSCSCVCPWPCNSDCRVFMQGVFTKICLAVVSSMNIGTVKPILYLGT